MVLSVFRCLAGAIALFPVLGAEAQLEEGSKWIQIEIDGNLQSARLAPDGSKALWAKRVARESHVFVSDADGTHVEQLSDSKSRNRSPDWYADGSQIVFESDRTGVPQIFTMDSDGGNVQQLTDDLHGCRNPTCGSQGYLAYQRLYEREGKVQHSDLVAIVDDDAVEQIENRYVSDFAWNPRGDVLAIGTSEACFFKDVQTGEMTEVKYLAIDERLYAHGAAGMSWAPDGDRIACQFNFLGGGIGHGEIFGDAQFFVITESGEHEVFSDLEDAQQTYDWITDRGH